MSTSLVVAVTVVYFLVGMDQLSKGAFGFALMWSSYALANIGLIWAGGTQ